MEEKNVGLKKLFFEKKYNELIFEIQTNIEKKHKNTAIQNLLGACIALRTDGKSKEDLIWATKIFKEAYESGNKTNDSLFALVNFINISMDIKKDFDIEINFKEIVKFFEEAILFFPHSEKLILAILRVYKYLNNLEMILFYLKGLVKKKKLQNKYYVYLYFV